MTPDLLNQIGPVLLLTAVGLGFTAVVLAGPSRDSRRAGPRAAVAAFAAALDDLETATDQYNAELEAEADRRELTGAARRSFYAATPESKEWLAANHAVAEASTHISAWQEFRVRNGLVKVRKARP